MELQEKLQKTIVFVSHDLEEAAEDRQPHLHHGGWPHRADGHAGRDRAVACQRLCARVHLQRENPMSVLTGLEHHARRA